MVQTHDVRNNQTAKREKRRCPDPGQKLLLMWRWHRLRGFGVPSIRNQHAQSAEYRRQGRKYQQNGEALLSRSFSRQHDQAQWQEGQQGEPRQTKSFLPRLSGQGIYHRFPNLNREHRYRCPNDPLTRLESALVLPNPNNAGTRQQRDSGVKIRGSVPVDLFRLVRSAPPPTLNGSQRCKRAKDWNQQRQTGEYPRPVVQKHIRPEAGDQPAQSNGFRYQPPDSNPEKCHSHRPFLGAAACSRENARPPWQKPTSTLARLKKACLQTQPAGLTRWALFFDKRSRNPGFPGAAVQRNQSNRKSQRPKRDRHQPANRRPKPASEARLNLQFSFKVYPISNHCPGQTKMISHQGAGTDPFMTGPTRTGMGQPKGQEKVPKTIAENQHREKGEQPEAARVSQNPGRRDPLHPIPLDPFLRSKGVLSRPLSRRGITVPVENHRKANKRNTAAYKTQHFDPKRSIGLLRREIDNVSIYDDAVHQRTEHHRNQEYVLVMQEEIRYRKLKNTAQHRVEIQRPHGRVQGDACRGQTGHQGEAGRLEIHPAPPAFSRLGHGRPLPKLVDPPKPVDVGLQFSPHPIAPIAADITRSLLAIDAKVPQSQSESPAITVYFKEMS